MKYKHLSLILLLTILLAPAANARKYYDAAAKGLKGHVKAVYKNGILIYNFDPSGKQTKPDVQYIYDTNGYPTQTKDGSYRYTYRQGRLTQVDIKTKYLNYTNKLSYSASGDLIDETLYVTYNGSIETKTAYSNIKSDSHGNPISYDEHRSSPKGFSTDYKAKLTYEYYDTTPATKPSSGQSKPQSEKQGGKQKPTTKPTAPQQTRGELSTLDFFDYPCGDRQLSWSMTFTEARKALGSSAKKCEEPARYFDNNDSQGKIYLEGKSPIDFGLTDYKAYMLSGNIDYRGRSLNTLKYNRASAQIVFYKNSETYSPGQDMREYSRSHSRLTAPGEAAYDYLIEKIKASGAQIRKWKYDSHERVKSCKAVYKGRVFLLMLNKDNVYGNYYIEISTAAYYTENS